MKILVTGATGFVGNHVIKYLLDNKIEVFATSRKEDDAKKMTWFHNVKYFQFDICDYDSENNLFEYFEKPDVLIHLAWSRLSNYMDIKHIEENLFEHSNFLKKYIESGGKQIVIAGTCLEYGDQNGLLSEEMAPKPNCPYAIAKDNLRRYMIELQKTNLFILQWVRLFYMYGEGQNNKAIIPQLEIAVRNCETEFNMSGGEQLRDYLSITTVAEYISKIAFQKQITGIINCSSGIPISIRKLIEDEIKNNNYNIKLNLGYYPYPSYEPMAFWGDCSKIKSIITN
jgi:dTDP-6-deoxy-L-talose 4-dehydrogenase (NAD+)